jgi:hypothetical protein
MIGTSLAVIRDPTVDSDQPEDRAKLKENSGIVP